MEKSSNRSGPQPTLVIAQIGGALAALRLEGAAARAGARQGIMMPQCVLPDRCGWITVLKWVRGALFGMRVTAGCAYNST